MNAELVRQAAVQSREVFAQSCSTAADAIGYMEQVLLVALEKQSAAASTEAPPVHWGAPKTIGMLIRQLQTLPADMPAHGAFFTDLHGERRAFIRPLSMSCERVNGQFIERGNQAVPYSLVIWSAQDERDAATAQAVQLRQAEALLERLLNPSDFGHAVTAEVRDAVRVVLGLQAVETSAQPVIPQPTAESRSQRLP